jgi:hypothetical protein
MLLWAMEGEEGLHEDQLRAIVRDHVTFACKGNLLLMYTDLSSAYDGRDPGEWKDRKLIEFFREYESADVKSYQDEHRKREEKLELIQNWIERELARGIDRPRNALRRFSYPPFGDENYYSKHGGRWDELAHTIDETIGMLEEFKQQLKRNSDRWAMPHQIPALIERGNWGRVIELSKYSTGPSGKYGGFSTFRKVYDMSEQSGFEEPSLSTMARFLSELHPSEVPTSNTPTVERIKDAVENERTMDVRDVRVYKKLAVATRLIGEGQWAERGSRLYLRKQDGEWSVKGSLLNWIH